MASELPGQLAPQRTYFRPVWLRERLAWRDAGTHEHRSPYHRQSVSAGAADDVLDLLGKLVNRDSRTEVVQRDHRVRLATTEAGLQVDHRGSALAGQPHDRVAEKLAQTCGEECSTEKLDRIRILGGALAMRHLVQVGCELCQSKATASDVVVGLYHLSPRFEARRWVSEERLGRRARFAGLRFEFKAHQLNLGVADFGSLAGVCSSKDPLDRIECPVGVVDCERVVVSPAVTDIAEFED